MDDEIQRYVARGPPPNAGMGSNYPHPFRGTFGGRGLGVNRHGQPRMPNRHDSVPNRGRGRARGNRPGAMKPHNWRSMENNPQQGTNLDRGISFKFLEELAQTESGTILMKIGERKDALMEFVKSPIARPDAYPLLMKILASVSQTSFDSLKLKFLIEICNSQFLIYLQHYLINLPFTRSASSNKLYWDNETDFWVNLIQFFECITNVSPSTALRTCLPLIESTTRICLQGLNDRHSFRLEDEYEAKLEELRSILTKREKEVEAKQMDNKHYHDTEDSEPPSSFRELSVVPTSEDLLERQPFIRANIIDGAYRDQEHYLDVQYRLLREDCYGPVREGIRQFIEEPMRKKYDSVRIFRNVSFVEPYVTNAKFGYVVQLDNKAQKIFKRINWEHSKRFIYGSLILFTKDKCKTFIIATVLDHEPKYLANGKIPVSLVDKSIGMEICFTTDKYTMIESEVYFEPYLLVLNAIKDPRFPEHLAMSKYIVNVEPTPKLPSYLEPQQMYEIQCTDQMDDDTLREVEETEFEVADFKTWPSNVQLGLNDSQYEAFKLALTHEFAVIQGPPGTGKTFLGVKVAKTLIENLSKGQSKWCLLVICYTNHALDQFLEALLPVTQSIVRIGNQSRNKVMNEYNISNRRKNLVGPNDPFWDEKNKLKDIRSILMGIQQRLFSLSYEVLGFNCVKQYVDEVETLCYFYGQQGGDPLHLWLFEHLDYNVGPAEVEEYNLVDFNMDIDESRRRKQEVLLDEIDDDEVDVGRKDLVKLEITFSQKNAIDELRTLGTKYKNAKSEDEAFNLQMCINELSAKIHLYSQMSAHRGQNDNVVFNRRNPRLMPTLDRWLCYFKWSDVISTGLTQKVVPLQHRFVEAAERYEEAKMILDLKYLKTAKVVGMTTSAAARLRKLLMALASPIVIVEEAAEVLEQHIITSLTKDTKHLILIGDHQQLRPSAAHMKLARHYNIEISLFERMIMNKIHSKQLSVQHRMRPEIAALICPHIYADLANHPSVKNFPDVRGITSNLFFLSHDYKEEVTEECSSKSNPREADLVLNLANYLVQQDYSPSDVTILSAYSGQMFYMRKARSNYSHLKDVKITVVDNYQGEESKIILLSLVRNNDQGKIGFLGTENRICVALSRAREGFYLFGNIEILRKNSELWEKIAGTLENSNSLGKCLTLRCEYHQEITTVTTAADFDKTPEGGCMLKCTSNLPCEHPCPLMCHSYDRGHLNTKCIQKCERLACDNGHVCPLMCAVKCEPCSVPVEKALPCGHTMSLPCSTQVDDPSVKCTAKMSIKHPDCGHEMNKMCHLKIKYVVCLHPCLVRVEGCGHQCTLTCHVKNDPHHEAYLCSKKCARAKAGCRAGLLGERGEHQCARRCHEPCDPCVVEVMKKRSGCTHSQRVPCNADVDAVRCTQKCTRALPCGHFCKKKCFEPCGDCTQMVTKTVEECGHSIKVECREVPSRMLCESKCERRRRCGHACAGWCQEPCEEDACEARVEHELPSPCGHRVRLPCHAYQEVLLQETLVEKYCLKYCDHPCGETLMCSHQCRGTCSGCLQGRLHAPCKEVCHQTNICGHQCKEPCNQVCPPCKVRCEVRCEHTRCNKLCGDICPPCQEACARRCEHGACVRRCGEPCSRPPCAQPCPRALPCGHACRGLCGEPCPDVCRICRPDRFPRDFLGDEFDDDARFVTLQDCNHVLELEDMDNLMMADKEIIGIKTCPFCRKPIINTPRYKDLINKTVATEINPVKERVYGTKEQIEIKFKEILEKVESMTHKDLKDMEKWQKCLNGIQNLRKGKKKMSLLQLNMLSLRLEIMEILDEMRTEYDSRRAQNADDDILMQFATISAYVNQNKKKISQQQQKDIGKEIKRLHSMIQLHKITSLDEYQFAKSQPKVAEIAAEARAAVFGWRAFEESPAMESLERLQTAVKLSQVVTRQERDMVVRAIGLKAGHWYKCPNGHPYCIADCGGAMVEARCLECDAIVGGSSHRLRADNAHAPEVDGSRYPAWSDHYDLANYDHL